MKTKYAGDDDVGTKIATFVLVCIILAFLFWAADRHVPQKPRFVYYLECCQSKDDCFELRGKHIHQDYFGSGWTVDSKTVATPLGGWCEEKSRPWKNE